MPVSFNESNAPQKFEKGALPSSYWGKVFLDDDGDVFIGSTSCDDNLMGIGGDGDIDMDPIISWPVRLAPAGYTVTFKND